MSLFNSLKPDTDRPVQVTYAVFLLYAFLAISLLVYLGHSIVFFFLNTEEYSQPQFLFDLFVTAIAYMLMLFVTVKIANGKNWARWFLLIGFVLSLVITTIGLRELISRDAISGVISLSQVLVTAVAVALLFQRPSSAWFKSGGLAGENDVKHTRPAYISNITKSMQNFVDQKDSKPRRILVATILYAVIGALACWGPFYLIIVRPESRYVGQRTSFGERLIPLAYGAIVAAMISLPLTYFRGNRFSKSTAFWIGLVIFMIAFLLAFIGGI